MAIQTGDLVQAAALGDEAAVTELVARHHRHLLRVADAALEGVPSLRSDPLVDGISSADLHRALAALDPTDRALVALRYVAELRSDEIGRAFGMSASGARGRLSRVLARLRGDLRDA